SISETPMIRKLLAVSLMTLLLAACGGEQAESTAPKVDPAASATSQLHQLFDDFWQSYLENNPGTASYIGDPRFNDRWGDPSVEAAAAEADQRREFLKRLDAIDRNVLSPMDQLNYDLFRISSENAIRQYEAGEHYYAINQRGGLQTQYRLASYMSFEDAEDYQDWISRLNALGDYAEAYTGLLRAAVEQGKVQPENIIRNIIPQLESQIVDSAEDSDFYAPFEEMAKKVSESDAERLRNEAKTAIENVVIPAYVAFKDFMENEYLPAARPAVGVWSVPGGRDYYKARVKNFTTTDLTPEEIHEIGLSEVKRIRGEMDKIIEEVGFEGSFEEFLTFLRTDPQFYYDTPEELLEAYRAISKKIDPEVVKLFGVLPRMPYGVIPIPDAVAPYTTTAYYNGPAADGSRAGFYYVNLYRPEVRPKYEMEALSIHEAVPGHHFQIALAMELGELPEFRRYGESYTAFVEGWGLYSESLGEDLGLYKDPYSKFGQLTYEMWRAVRLVVDTGMHYKEWTRQEAIDFFAANAAKTEKDIENEIDRYIGWPGQALAYKIGELKIKALRAEAEKALGDDFDIKAWHDHLLGAGSIPLSLLEKRMDDWVSEQKSVK
ncbi:MAG: DUF885 domain-containing protein, partial [Gammaproteobacteria bacterium]|nr:DUF885 domain-containing protein [Gammaproteobacteria bacterium]